MSIIERDGFDFSFDSDRCKDCPGSCCRGESGHIWVNQGEMLQICSFLNIPVIDFIRTCLNRVDHRFSIKERFTGQGFDCIFFEDDRKRCSIYPVRPFQCRQYPFWEYFKEHTDQVVKECPGIITKKQCP
ncbi:MAG: YkgJ family cysteine cluster protein [bacterium]